MDKLTQHYIEDIVKPMSNRLQYLQRNNEQLKIHIKYLESLILNNIKSYQKPTVSATKHMRESKVLITDNEYKRPNWNSKTKLDQPTYDRLNFSLDLEEREQFDKDSFMPFIKKNKNFSPQHQSQQRKIASGKQRKSENIGQTNYKYRQLTRQDRRYSSFSNEFAFQTSQTNSKEQQQVQFERNDGLIRQSFDEIGRLTYKFQQLIRNNANIVNSMKKQNQNARQILQEKEYSISTYGRNVRTAKSEYLVQSQIGSPNDQSFNSQPSNNQQNSYQKTVKQNLQIE